MSNAKRIFICILFSVVVLFPSDALWAQSACDDFECNRSGQIMCNADLDCTRLQPFCINGVCQQLTCNNDGDCPSLMACSNGACEEVACKTAEDCSTGKVCINHRCEGCDDNAQCGEYGVCQNNECVCVECRLDRHCDFDKRCEGNLCVDFCDEDKEFVVYQDGATQCRACVDPRSAQRCPDPRCLAPGKLCASGFCLQACAPQDLEIFERDGLLEELIEEIGRLRTQPDPGGLPDCPRCTIGFDMISVRGILERAGVTEPVHLRLLDSSGKAVAEFGTFSPKGQSWSTIPDLMQPDLMQSVASKGGCGYMLEVSDPKSKKTARGDICLEPREKPLPLRRSL